MHVHIRWMIRRDLPQVLDIETRSFPSPWTEKEFLQMFRAGNCIGMVAEGPDAADPIHGYMIYLLQRHTIEIANFAVHPQARRRGVGQKMVMKLAGKVSDPCRPWTSRTRNRVVVDVCETNLPAQLFFRAMGFRAVRVMPDHCEEVDEAAYRFVLRAAALVSCDDGRGHR